MADERCNSKWNCPEVDSYLATSSLSFGLLRATVVRGPAFPVSASLRLEN